MLHSGVLYDFLATAAPPNVAGPGENFRSPSLSTGLLHELTQSMVSRRQIVNNHHHHHHRR